MVGDQFGDVTLRIENSRAIVREAMIAVEQSKRLVLDAREQLVEHRAEMNQRESAEDGPATDL